MENRRGGVPGRGGCWLAPLSLYAALVAGGPAVAADVAYGAYLAAECTTCHRPQANEAGIPAIEGLAPDDFIEALQAYRDGRRDNATMRSVARSLGDAEMEALAAYFASKQP